MSQHSNALPAAARNSISGSIRSEQANPSLLTRPITVRNLCCHRDVPFAEVALRSLHDYSLEPILFIIHDDGSLDDSDCERLTRSIPRIRVIRRSTADAMVETALQPFPLLSEARKLIPFFLKLVDLCLIDPDPATCFVDSDVLFTRPITGLFDLTRHRASAVFMTDIRSAYGFRLRDMWPWGTLRFGRRVNSGLFCFATALHDLAFLENTLQSTGISQALQHRGWYEQGLWAAIAHRFGARLYSREQIMLAETPQMITDDPVAVHLTGTAKAHLFSLFSAAKARSASTPGIPPAAITCVPGHEFTIAEAFTCAVLDRSRSLYSHRHK